MVLPDIIEETFSIDDLVGSVEVSLHKEDCTEFVDEFNTNQFFQHNTEAPGPALERGSMY